MKNVFNFVHSQTYLSVKPTHVTAVGFNLSLLSHLKSRSYTVQGLLVICKLSSFSSLSQNKPTKIQRDQSASSVSGYQK